TLPGLYVLMRQQGREACRLRLDAPSMEGEAADARLERPCPDTGITIFDPTTWRYAGGRLTLVARKGHGVDLVFEEGVWRKDPAVGAPLLLRRLQP
ncbi:MAG: protease inhibitor Inh/omp19 family protein, partial [Beijerinckiaceae bacterium]|nr:protease inhibitor Inh/omp19 family protein [Beijerinckiaceae bacterium]